MLATSSFSDTISMMHEVRRGASVAFEYRRPAARAVLQDRAPAMHALYDFAGVYFVWPLQITAATDR